MLNSSRQEAIDEVDENDGLKSFDDRMVPNYSKKSLENKDLNNVIRYCNQET